MDIVHDGGTLVLAGDFDGRTTMEVRSAIYDHLDGCDQDLVVDISGVPSCDLTALRVLAAASRYAARQGRHLRLRGPCPSVHRLLLLSHLNRMVEIERTAASA